MDARRRLIAAGVIEADSKGEVAYALPYLDEYLRNRLRYQAGEVPIGAGTGVNAPRGRLGVAVSGGGIRLPRSGPR